MPLEDIYVQEMDRATSKLEVTRINPTRQFIKVDLKEDGIHWAGSPAVYWWQNGNWFDTGGQPLDASEVPEKFRKEIEANPVTVNNIHGPAVTWVCEFCGDKMNMSEQGEHLKKHMRDVVAQAGTLKPDEIPPPVPKSDANRHKG